MAKERSRGQEKNGRICKKIQENTQKYAMRQNFFLLKWFQEESDGGRYPHKSSKKQI